MHAWPSMPILIRQFGKSQPAPGPLSRPLLTSLWQSLPPRVMRRATLLNSIQMSRLALPSTEMRTANIFHSSKLLILASWANLSSSGTSLSQKEKYLAWPRLPPLPLERPLRQVGHIQRIAAEPGAPSLWAQVDLWSLWLPSSLPVLIIYKGHAGLFLILVFYFILFYIPSPIYTYIIDDFSTWWRKSKLVFLCSPCYNSVIESV